MDTATSDIRAVAFTPMPDLLSQVPDDVDIGTVTADGTCDTRRCHSAMIAHGATAFGHSLEPSAIGLEPMAPPWATVRARNETQHTTRHHGRAVWKRWTGYHIRRCAETRIRGLNALGTAEIVRVA